MAGPDLLVALAGGMLAGLFAALVATVPMEIVPDGYVPALVAAGRLRGRGTASVNRREAVLVHYVIGTTAGGLFGLLVVWLGTAGLPVDPLDGATAAVLVVVYGIVAWILLPLSSLSRARFHRARLAWAISAIVYTFVLRIGSSVAWAIA